LQRRAAAPGASALAVHGVVAIVALSRFEATFSLFADRRFDLTEAGVAAVFVGIGIALVAVQVGLVRPVSARIGPANALRVGLGLNAVGLLVLAPADTWPVLVAALALLTVGQGLVAPNLATLVSAAVPALPRGEAVGFPPAVTAAGGVVGPVRAGLLFGRVSISAPYLVGAALCGVALVVALRDRAPSPIDVDLGPQPLRQHG
jgi:MFS family permease